MKITKSLLAAAGFVALAACGDNDAAENNVDANVLATDNLGTTNDLNTLDANLPANDLNITANNVTVVNEGAAANDTATNTGNTM